MSIETNPQGRPSIRLTLPTIGAISAIVGVLVYVVGFATGYIAFKSEMSSLREQVAELRAGNASTQDRLNNLGNRLTSIESDTKYISQGVAELRLSAVPRH
jgi:hypothetical protein